jgi:tRNA pseudouridine32 synthase / 23S rRNA pseudouridine746 synthase
MTLSVLYEDEFLIAINKENGISVIPGRGDTSSPPLVQIVEKFVSRKLYVVHRLDKETSGVILFAKDAATHRLLNAQFEKREIQKQYLAFVLGIPQSGGVIDSPIFEFGSGRMGIDKRGKPAKTEFKVIDSFSNTCLLNVFPATGRRHQIRVHLYSQGFPILGDRIYGNPRPIGGFSRLMLHAQQITFTHPDKQLRTIDASVNDEWKGVLSQISSVKC